MPTPPTPDELARAARSLHLEPAAAELDEYGAVAREILENHRRLDELPDGHPRPVTYPRTPGYRPSAEDDPHRAWVWRCSVRGADTGPLAGARVAIKDNTAVAGVPMRNGTSLLEGYVPDEDATVVTRLLEAGGEIVGKTAVPSLCFDGAGITCYPEQPRNPYDPARAPGGSSAGSAVAVATGEVDLALGGDQGGSVRLPAAWSGCCGHKPTYGLVPYTGAFAVERTLDHLGPMAPTVAGCARMLEVVAGDDGDDPRQAGLPAGSYVAGLDRGLEGIRLGVLREAFDRPGLSEPEVDRAVHDAVAALSAAGAAVEEVSVPMHRDGLALWNVIGVEGATECMLRGDGLGTNWRGHYATSLADTFGPARRARARDLSAPLIGAALLGSHLSETYHHHYYAKAQNLGRTLRGRYDEVLERVDALVMPTTPMTAVPLPERPGIAETVQLALGTNLHNTAPFNVTGHPALSVPCGLSDGLPVGLQIVGRHGDDATVLRVGHAYEQRRGPFPRPRS